MAGVTVVVEPSFHLMVSNRIAEPTNGPTEQFPQSLASGTECDCCAFRRYRPLATVCNSESPVVLRGSDRVGYDGTLPCMAVAVQVRSCVKFPRIHGGITAVVESQPLRGLRGRRHHYLASLRSRTEKVAVFTPDGVLSANAHVPQVLSKELLGAVQPTNCRDRSFLLARSPLCCISLMTKPVQPV